MDEPFCKPLNAPFGAVDAIPIPEAEIAKLERLIEQAQGGDAEVLPELRRTLADRPTVWQHVGNLGQHAENAWVQKIAGQDQSLAEGLRQRLKTLRDDLVGEKPGPMDELLVRQVSLTYLQSEFYEITIATLPVDAPAKHHNFLEQRRDTAHRRHLQALKSFAETRKLLAESPHSLTVTGRKPARTSKRSSAR